MSEFDGTSQAEISNLNKNENINTHTNSTNKAFNAKQIEDTKECDDGVCEDWEQLNQQKIQKSLQTKKLTNTDEEKNLINGTSNSNLPLNTPVFTNVPAQPIKILQRPNSNKNLNELAKQNPNNNQSKQPIKSLEQREQEYAQARLRILGSAHPDETPSGYQVQPNVNSQQNTNNTKNMIAKNNFN